jgi:hypothetical protein
MENQVNKDSLLAAYCVPGFQAQVRVDVYEGQHAAFVITLKRRQKKRCAVCATRHILGSMTAGGGVPAIWDAAGGKFIWTSRCAV